MRKLLSLIVYSFVILFACVSGDSGKENVFPANIKNKPAKTEGDDMAFEITSNNLDNGEQILRKYTCEGDNISPHLRWSAPPAGTAEFVLICEDPDAPSRSWVHWLVYGLSYQVRELPEGTGNIPGQVGINDFGDARYGGPCPPTGSDHRYFFTVYALDKKLGLSDGMRRNDLLEAMGGHILGKAQLMGIYSR